MADEETKADEVEAEAEEAEVEAIERAGDDDLADAGQVGMTPVQLGATKYVHAAFFAAGILGAFLAGKLLATVWNFLAEWPAAVRAVPALLRYAEDERPTFTMAVGAVIGLGAIIHTYRKESTRRWADEVASELAKVVWPNKETVTNGTIVVIIASLIATVYIGLLDRFWGFLTTLVYGA